MRTLFGVTLSYKLAIVPSLGKCPVRDTDSSRVNVLTGVDHVSLTLLPTGYCQISHKGE